MMGFNGQEQCWFGAKMLYIWSLSLSLSLSVSLSLSQDTGSQDFPSVPLVGCPDLWITGRGIQKKYYTFIFVFCFWSSGCRPREKKQEHLLVVLTQGVHCVQSLLPGTVLGWQHTLQEYLSS